MFKSARHVIRDSRVQLLLTVDERKQFEAAAGRDGMTLSGWVRAACRERLRRERGAK